MSPKPDGSWHTPGWASFGVSIGREEQERRAARALLAKADVCVVRAVSVRLPAGCRTI